MAVRFADSFTDRAERDLFHNKKRPEEYNEFLVGIKSHLQNIDHYQH